MSLLRAVVVVFATLSLFAGFAAALPGKEDHPDYPDDHHPKIWGPKCYDDKWKWTYNSLGQHPCEIAAYLLSTCHGGSFSIPPLGPKKKYEVPCKDDICWCNPVIYSLISACEACQGGKWHHFEKYIRFCPKVEKPGCFPYPVPKGTRVPKWALLDVTSGDGWDPVKAQAVCDQPDVGPGTDLV